MATVNKKEAIDILRRLKTRAARLEHEDYDTAAFDKWLRDVEIAIEHIFGQKSRSLEDFRKIEYEPEEEDTSDQEDIETFDAGMELDEATLQSMIDEIRQFWPDNDDLPVSPNQLSEQPTLSKGASKRVFIVHGQDDTMKEPVARVITQLGLAPIILHEQPNKGRTI